MHGFQPYLRGSRKCLPPLKDYIDNPSIRVQFPALKFRRHIHHRRNRTISELTEMLDEASKRATLPREPDTVPLSHDVAKHSLRQCLCGSPINVEISSFDIDLEQRNPSLPTYVRHGARKELE